RVDQFVRSAGAWAWPSRYEPENASLAARARSHAANDRLKQEGDDIYSGSANRVQTSRRGGHPWSWSFPTTREIGSGVARSPRKLSIRLSATPIGSSSVMTGGPSTAAYGKDEGWWWGPRATGR